MKPKLVLEELQNMEYSDYLKVIKKEVKKAATLGRTEFVVLSDFKFKNDPAPHAVLVFGEFSGKLQKYYNKQRKERSAEKDFGRGVAYFEENVDGTTTIHLGLEAGKAKAAKIKKNGKKLFKKLGLDVNVYRGELQLDEADEDAISDEEEDSNSKAADALVQNERISKIQKQYIKLFQQVTQLTLPKLKAGTEVDSSDFDNCKQLYIFTEAYQREFETLTAAEKPEYQPTLEKVKANAEQIKKIYAKVKQLAMAQNPEEEDWTTVTKEDLHAVFEEVAALSSFPPLLEKELALEAEEPIAPTQIKQQIQAFEAAIETAANKAKAYEISEPKSFAALNTQIETWKLQLTEAKAKDEAFDAKRAAEQELLKQLQGKWGELEELQGHCDKLLAEKKASKELFNYEKAIVAELVESLGIRVAEIEVQPKRVKAALAADLQQATQDSQKLEAILQSYKVVPHPSGKDAYYDAYVQIDQTQPASVWMETIEKLNDWLTEQEGVKEKFEEKVSLEVVHLNQAYLYSLDDLTENDIKKVGKDLTLKTATIEEKKKALRKKNGYACKDTCEKMISNYNPSLKVKAFNIIDGSGYLSIAKENKSNIEELVDKDETKIESLESDALDYQETAKEAYNYIFENLNINKPLVVGVDHTYNTFVDQNGKIKSSSKNAGYNIDKTTDHFILIVGKGMENGVPYLEYLDPGTKDGGKNSANRLYPLWKNGNMYWYDPKAADWAGTYCLTTVSLFQ